MNGKPFTACTLYRWDHTVVANGIDVVRALERGRATANEKGGTYVVVRESDFRMLATVAPFGKRHPGANDMRAWLGRMAVIRAGEMAA